MTEAEEVDAAARRIVAKAEHRRAQDLVEWPEAKPRTITDCERVARAWLGAAKQ